MLLLCRQYFDGVMLILNFPRGIRAATMGNRNGNYNFESGASSNFGGYSSSRTRLQHDASPDVSYASKQSAYRRDMSLPSAMQRRGHRPSSCPAYGKSKLRR